MSPEAKTVWLRLNRQVPTCQTIVNSHVCYWTVHEPPSILPQVWRSTPFRWSLLSSALAWALSFPHTWCTIFSLQKVKLAENAWWQRWSLWVRDSHQFYSIVAASIALFIALVNCIVLCGSRSVAKDGVHTGLSNYIVDTPPANACHHGPLHSTAGPPLLHGTITSLISTLFLVVSDVAFNRSYYFGMFLGYLFLDFINGLVLLPVLLSMYGDRKVAIPQKEQQKRRSVQVCKEYVTWVQSGVGVTMTFFLGK